MIRPGHSVVLCVMALLCIGVIMVNSAGLSIDAESAVTLKSILLSRSTFYMVLSLLAMGVIAQASVTYFLRVRFLARWAPLIAILVIGALATVYLPIIGHEVNGSRRWIRVPGVGMTMQPSEFAKWAMVLLVGFYAVHRASDMHRFFGGLLPGLCFVGVVAGMVALEDLGTGVLIAAASCVVLIAGGARIMHFVLMAPLGLLGIAALVITSPYRVRRLLSFLDPYADPEGAGYHMIQSLGAVANGKVFGRGLGFGLQKFGYLPEDRTDFLFAVICEELGLIGAAGVIALYLALFWSAWGIVKRQTEPLVRLVGLGIVATLGLQTLMNLTVVTGLAPTKGIALPMLSSGGTGWILTAMALGLIVAMDRCAGLDRAAAPESADVRRPVVAAAQPAV